MTEKHKQRWQLEVQIMQRLDHENVIAAMNVPEVLDVRPNELPLLAMEYCSGGDLRRVCSVHVPFFYFMSVVKKHVLPYFLIFCQKIFFVNLTFISEISSR